MRRWTKVQGSFDALRKVRPSISVAVFKAVPREGKQPLRNEFAELRREARSLRGASQSNEVKQTACLEDDALKADTLQGWGETA